MNKDQLQVSVAVAVAVGFIGTAACFVQFATAPNTAAVGQKAAAEPQALESKLAASKSLRTTAQVELESRQRNSQTVKSDRTSLVSEDTIRGIDLLPKMPDSTSGAFP